MKRKIAVLLTAVMATTSTMNIMAASTNSASRTVNVKENSKLTDVELTIRPTDGNYRVGESFYIELKNGTFDEKVISDKTEANKVQYNFKKLFDDANVKTAIKTVYNVDLTDTTKKEEAVKAIFGEKDSKKFFTDLLNTFNGSDKSIFKQIPYVIEYVNSTQIKVTLVPFTNDELTLAAQSTKVGIRPYVSIPVSEMITSSKDNDESNDIVLAINGNSTTISSSNVTIGTLSSSSSSTTTTIAGSTTFDESVTLKDITVKENVIDSLITDDTKTVTLRLSSGFEFSTKTGVEILPSINMPSTAAKVEDSNISLNDSKNTLTFKIPKNWENKTGTESKLRSFVIKNLKVVPTNEDKSYGEVKMTISGDAAGVTTQDLVVANRQKAGYTMVASEDPKTIVSGRHYNVGKNQNVSFKGTLKESGNVAAKFKFGETVAHTWDLNKRLEFNLPEGVQVYKVTVKDVNGNFKSVSSDKFNIINNGRTIRINRGALEFDTKNTNKLATLEFTLDLSIDAAFTGDVKVSVNGGGMDQGAVADVVIAKAIAPISIETKTTNVNVGYQDYTTADVTITEAEPGMLMEGENAEIFINSPYLSSSNSEIGFSNAEYEVDSNELAISDFKVSGGKISFKVKTGTYNKPATIKLKNMKIAATRSVPYGAYSLGMGGQAVINNYNKSLNSNIPTNAASGNEFLMFTDTTSYYAFKEYINVVTSTGTLDSVVKVTVGEKTISMNGTEAQMDVAPYIQAASNSTMVPLRFVSVALGVDDATKPDESSRVSYDPNSKIATIYFGSGANQKLIQFQAGSNKMTINGTAIGMENGVVAEIKDGRMFVPFRALGQALGVNVSWNADTRTAIYNSNN